MMNWKRFAMCGCFAATLIGCGTQPDEPTDSNTDDGVVKASWEDKADRWNWRNDPARFRTELEFNYDALPLEGASESVAWAADYWPTYKDSINQRWQGRNVLSPAEKYDVAFNDWEATDEFMELAPYDNQTCEWDEAYYAALGPAASWQSQYKGNARARNGRDDDGDGLEDAEECGYGENADYDGVETWWGLCHAWVPAAILEDEPVKSVTRNGVTFDVSDLKALIIMQYDRMDAFMLGGRCNDKEVERDETGRVMDEDCRDINAGSFHVILANFLGLQKRAIAIERVIDYEVWNHPLVGFKVTEEKEITKQEAIELLRLDGEEYIYNEDAERFVEIRLTTDYITESPTSTQPNSDVISRYTRHDSYHYLLELDGNGDVIGGEWVGASNTKHPDFLWLPTRAVSGNPHVDIDVVRELIAQSRGEDDGGDETEGRIFEMAATDSVAVPDDDPQGATSTFTIEEEGVIRSLTLDLSVDHTYRGDLLIELSNGPVTVTVYNGSDADEAWGDGVELTGEVVPGFEGARLTGEWTLRVIDTWARDTGSLEGWTLRAELER